MGVPKLFQSLIQKYHHHHVSNPTGYNIIIPKINTLIPTHLYLDFNGGIYQCIKQDIKTEETLILHVIEYLEFICNIIPNLELIFIALDGVPPAGKIKNQRERRFHSVAKKYHANNINEKYGIKLDKNTQCEHDPNNNSGANHNNNNHNNNNHNNNTNNNHNNNTNTNTNNINNFIDTNMITPGTIFMYNLSIAIKKQISNGGHNNIFNNKKIIFSDASIPGEGEHKLIHHIKECTHKAVDGSDEDRILYGKPHNTVIYALDGDLIFLSMSLHLDNVYLFREANEYGNFASIHNDRKYLFMDINELTNAIITSFQDIYGCTNVIINKIKNRYINDYIFLGMLLGNDFMPKTHWFSIAEGGFEKLLSAYWQIHNHTEIFLVDVYAMTINTEMLCDLIYIVKSLEHTSIIKLFEKRKTQRINIKSYMTEQERQQTLIDFYPLQYLNIEQAIAPLQSGWQSRYYNICLNMEHRPENIKLICQSYLKTLVWNFHYYFSNSNSDSDSDSNSDSNSNSNSNSIIWDWVYNFDYCPLWDDIYNELLLHKNINITSSNKIFHFNKSKPVNQQTLLFMVLPLKSKQFMIRSINNTLSDEKCPMHIYFPSRYALNVAFHRYYHECTPIIYKMETKKINKFIKECYLTDDEKKRNIIGSIYVKN